jgi:hypothetical protein
MEKWTNIIRYGQVFSNTSAIRRGEFVRNRTLYIILRGQWRNIIALNVHALCEDKRDDVKHSFYEELRSVF